MVQGRRSQLKKNYSNQGKTASVLLLHSTILIISLRYGTLAWFTSHLSNLVAGLYRSEFLNRKVYSKDRSMLTDASRRAFVDRLLGN